MAFYRLSEFYKGWVKAFTGRKFDGAWRYSANTLTLVEKDLKTVRKLHKELNRKRQVGYLSSRPTVKSLAEDAKRNLKESGPFPPQG